MVPGPGERDNRWPLSLRGTRHGLAEESCLPDGARHVAAVEPTSKEIIHRGSYITKDQVFSG
eukprot:COSAG05_NODE_2118_length_3536_cov_3.709340_4_plen_62_part_00